MRNRPSLPQDNVGRPCNCLLCQKAGATELRTVRVPADEFHPHPRWLHGEELKNWHAARLRVRERFKALREKLTMPGAQR